MSFSIKNFSKISNVVCWLVKWGECCASCIIFICLVHWSPFSIAVIWLMVPYWSLEPCIAKVGILIYVWPSVLLKNSPGFNVLARHIVKCGSMKLKPLNCVRIYKEIEMIHRLFLVFAIYCQGSSNTVQWITKPPMLLAGWEGSLGTWSR